jgi:hypothetical protein
MRTIEAASTYGFDCQRALTGKTGIDQLRDAQAGRYP